MKILVTGATGFVASNVVDVLSELGNTVVALDVRPPEAPLPDGVTFAQADVRDVAALARAFEEHRPRHVVHMAAVTPDPAMERDNPQLVLEVNELGTLNALELSARFGVARVVAFSSVSAYGDAGGALVIDEDSPLEGYGIYACTKVAGERLCERARRQDGLDVRVLRPGPVYGPYERPTGFRERMSLVYQGLRLALAGEPLRCNAPNATRGWVHARDVARAVARLLETPEPRRHTYLIAGESVSIHRTLDAVAAAVPGTAVEWVASIDDANLPVPEGDSRAVYDMRHIREDLDFEHAYDIEGGIGQYAEWLRTHQV